MLDHSRLLCDPAYLDAIRARIADRAQQRGLFELHVMHEEDDSCCRLEPWATTSVRVFALTFASVGAAR